MNYSRLIRSAIGMALMLQLSLPDTLFAETVPGKPEEKKPERVDGYQIIEWTDLMPKEDLDALMNPPEYLSEIEDGSAEDQIASEMRAVNKEAADSRYEQALVSTRVVPAFDSKQIRLPGFIVPLEFGDDQRVTEFFLVPFFGACIHVPPPPPNQIIFARYPEGIMLEALYDPFWVSGGLKITMTENETATSAYSMKVEKIEPYKEQ